VTPVVPSRLGCAEVEVEGCIARRLTMLLWSALAAAEPSRDGEEHRI